MLTFGLSLNFSHAALSAITANTIQGTAPSLSSSISNKLGFTLNGTYYSESIGNVLATTEFDKELFFGDFVVNLNTIKQQFTTTNDYVDNDGDDAHLTTPFTVGTLGYKWTDRFGNVIYNNTGDGDYTVGMTGAGNLVREMVGCSDRFFAPYTLTIEVNDAQVYSQYGDPDRSEKVKLSKSYTINSSQGICWLRPGSIETGSGFTSDFIEFRGFKPNATVSSYTFPTTGFPGAKFLLKMAGGQDTYTFSILVNPGDGILVTSDGLVKLNSKPSGEVKVKAKLNAHPGTEFIYSFDVSRLWIEPQQGLYTYDEAKIACGGEENIPTRLELTSSPYATAPSDWDVVFNAQVRTIGNGDQLFGEWGRFNSPIYEDILLYPDSDWEPSGFYWTKDKHDPNSFGKAQRFNVWALSGAVGYGNESSARSLACKK